MRSTWGFLARAGTGGSGCGTESRRARGAFTLLELMITVTLVSLLLVALSNSIITSMKATGVNKESALASDGIAEMVERLQGVGQFQQVFALYNANPNDDPGMPGTAPGNHFAIKGLQVPDDEPPGGSVGEIVFPTIGNQLREDVVNPDLGMPRDLNGDGIIDSADHAGDYKVLPVLIRVHWKGLGAKRSMVVRTILANR
jgi:prepilin-type N-terminal cleavage/methylation domain-containing protein